MHRIATGLFLTLGLLATSVVTAGAQVYGYNIPPGSYQQSCSNERVNGATLSASCTANNGQQRWSSLNVNGCNGDIANNNGQLTCYGYNGGYNNGGYGYNNPGRGRDRDDDDNDGDNGRGHAYGHRHHENNGRWNNNGGYNGGYGGGYNAYGGYGLPGGSYQQSCQNARMNGAMLSASCTAPNGQWIGSSIDVRRCQSRDIANRNGYLSC